MASLIGKTLKNRYRVDELLGRGGMAEVYKVYDLQRGVPLAMKVLREDLAEDRVFLRRFQREAQNLAKLQHPNIVRFYGLEQKDRLAFILMDYIEGSTLRGKIFDAHGPLTDREVLEIMEPVCSALSYAHQQGIVHCDLKSANIMIDKAGRVYLTDFGIARMTDMATSTMVGVGTPAYMAPELIMEKDPTPQSDIYALGIVLFEMLTGGERPFTGEQASTTGTTAEKVRWEQLHLEPPSVKSFNPHVSDGVDKVISCCLCKDPFKRFSNSIEIINTLENILVTETQFIRNNDLIDLSSNSSKDRREKTDNEKEHKNIRSGFNSARNISNDRVENKRNAENQRITENPNSPNNPPKKREIKRSSNKNLIIYVGLILVFMAFLCNLYVSKYLRGKQELAYTQQAQSAQPSIEKQQTITQKAKNTQEINEQQITATAKQQITATAEQQLVDLKNKCLIVCSTNGNIFLQDVKGEYINDLSVNGENPSWSPDGNLIAFDYNGFIYTMAINGSNITQLTWGENPSWSPDGKLITFIYDNYIYTMAIDGSNITQLAEGRFALWSPDGKNIIFFPEKWGGDIYIMDSKGSNIRKLVEGSSPSWSPDGDRIYFEHGDAIYSIDPNGNNYSKITWLNDSWQLRHISISPNGNQIIFTNSVFDTYNVFIVGIGGSNPRRLTRKFAKTDFPSWSPDGKKILFSAGDSLYISDLSGNDIVQLKAFASSIDWSPTCVNNDNAVN